MKGGPRSPATPTMLPAQLPRASSVPHLVLGPGHQKGVEAVPGYKGAGWWSGKQLEEQWDTVLCFKLPGPAQSHQAKPSTPCRAHQNLLSWPHEAPSPIPSPYALATWAFSPSFHHRAFARASPPLWSSLLLQVNVYPTFWC